MIHFVTFLWNGWRPVYGPQHVNALSRMLAANMSMPYSFTAIVDDPKGITECPTFPLWAPPEVNLIKTRNSFTRLRLFDPSVALLFGAEGDWVVNVDLDCVIIDDLQPLIESALSSQCSFAAVRGRSAPINGSMWMNRIGSNTHVWESFTKDAPAKIAATKHNGKTIIGSDQAWMSMKIKHPATWGPEDGVAQYLHLHEVAPTDAKVVFFAGATKPWDLACKQQHPELYDTYKFYLGNA